MSKDYTLSESAYEDLTGVYDALFRVIDRAKYYKDPISFEAVESLARDLKNVISVIEAVDDSDWADAWEHA